MALQKLDAPELPDVPFPDFSLPDLMAGLEAPPETLAPAMTEAEVRLLLAAAEGARRLVEFGCGGSTALLLGAAPGPLLSVDSDAAWLARVRAQPAVARALQEGRFTSWHAELGPLGDWGWPVEPPTPDTAWRYWGGPWLLAPRADFVLVDGRFRVACALAAHSRLAPGGRLAVHDFWSRRAYQDALAPFYQVTGSAGTLALLTPREAPPHMLAAAQEHFAADPR